MFEPIKSTVGVVVLEERDQRRRDRNELFRRDVHVLDLHPVGRDEFTLLTGGVSLVDEVALFVKLDIGLADDVAVLFPCGQVERIRLETRPLSRRLYRLVGLPRTSSSGTCSPGLNFVSPPFWTLTYSITRPSSTFR